jgi:hypothetical protein
MVNVQGVPLTERQRGGDRLSAYVRRFVAAALAVPGQRRSLALSDGEPQAVLVEAEDGVTVHWAAFELSALPSRFEGVEAARLAIEAARGRPVHLTPFSSG